MARTKKVIVLLITMLFLPLIYGYYSYSKIKVSNAHARQRMAHGRN